MTECFSRFTLVRFHKKDLTDETHQRIQTHLDECSRCRDVLGEIQTNDAAYNRNATAHSKRLMEALASEIQSENAADSNSAVSKVVAISSRKTKKNVYILIPLAAAAALTLALYFLPYFKSAPLDEITYKGGFSAGIIAKRADEQFTVRPNDVLRENDALRFRIQTSGAGYLYIMNIAANGEITGLCPFDAPLNSPGYLVDAAGEHVLDESVVLDNSIGTEQIVFVFHSQPLSIDLIQKHADDIIKQKTLPLKLRGGHIQFIQFEKK
ncbi:MAG: hypothetical protein JXX29_13630 [Deltaproteobacteria bacterium]|nr:hypothetical protein [Deltaproteobacteria bacterium]MBN2672720.1 hypothetical protein [Deltaproteobacteria bacterium]